MRKKAIGFILAVVYGICVLTACGNGQTAENGPRNDVQVEQAVQTSPITLAAADAVIDGYSYNAEGVQTDTAYDAENQAIVCFGEHSDVQYTVPDIQEGSYDIYVSLSKTTYAFASTPVNITVHDDTSVVRSNLNSCAKDMSDLYEMGIFLAKEDVTLKSGDTITLTGNPGLENMRDGKMLSLMPSLGNVYLYPANSDVAVGYGEGRVEAEEAVDESDALSGLNIAWLGSSVTFGMDGNGYAVADAIADNHAATKSYKYAIAGTKLITDKPSSYVERMKQIDPEQAFDLFVVQFSTNDATEKSAVGTVSGSKEMDSFDTMTVAGALEYIIAYIGETWNCPVAIYTNTRYDSPEYTEMMTIIPEIQQKWGVTVIDLWNNDDMNQTIESGEAEKYMIDSIHPNTLGYTEWWTPVFEDALAKMV